jgi:predicted 2-oxoglutarate/Fe(II)-dependent dioxygenase YbiX
MLLTIPDVLSREDALALRERIVAAEWVDGNVTSGSGAATVKRNRQLPEDAPITQAAQAEVTSALMDNAAFLSAALPHSVFPPLHRVTPVTRGERISCFFWLQSLVSDHASREMLYELDQSVQVLSGERGKNDKEVLRLTALYHNLVRRWAQA